MPKVNFEFYMEWVGWWFKITTDSITQGDLTKASNLVRGGKYVIQDLLKPFKLFPELKGSALTIGYKLYNWAKENKDPLQSARETMNHLRKTYDKEN